MNAKCFYIYVKHGYDKKKKRTNSVYLLTFLANSSSLPWYSNSTRGQIEMLICKKIALVLLECRTNYFITKL